jgi:hypothetical protein
MRECVRAPDLPKLTLCFVVADVDCDDAHEAK